MEFVSAPSLVITAGSPSARGRCLESAEITKRDGILEPRCGNGCAVRMPRGRDGRAAGKVTFIALACAAVALAELNARRHGHHQSSIRTAETPAGRLVQGAVRRDPGRTRRTTRSRRSLWLFVGSSRTS